MFIKWERQTYLCDPRHEFVINHLSNANLANVDLRRGCCLEEEPRDVRPVPMSILPLVGSADKTLALTGVDAPKFDSRPDLWICIIYSGI